MATASSHQGISIMLIIKLVSNSIHYHIRTVYSSYKLMKLHLNQVRIISDCGCYASWPINYYIPIASFLLNVASFNSTIKLLTSYMAPACIHDMI